MAVGRGWGKVETQLTLIIVIHSIALTLCACPWESKDLVPWSPSWNTPGGNVVINRPVLLSTSPRVKLGSITVAAGGTLVIRDSTEITVGWIFVRNGGKLIIGNTACPIKGKVVITFVGVPNGDSPMSTFGKKGLAVEAGGHLSLEGVTSGVSWAFLARTANAGSTSVTLDQVVAWDVGDSVVVAGSVHYFAGRQHEVKTIKSISADKKTITFTTPLAFQHAGVAPERSEVGLLSRHIILQGDQDSVAPEFGGHVLLNSVNVRVAGVEFTRMGQKGVLGRYPLHFHFLNPRDGRVAPPYTIQVVSNSFHDNFHRGITLHDSNNVDIFDNVCYNTFGHMFFLEDASEMGNSFRRNLGILAQNIPASDPRQLFPHDGEASIFWITNPSNNFVSNSAVNAKRGFWWAMPEDVLGQTKAFFREFHTPLHPKIQPRYLPMGRFLNNIAHSCGHGFLMADFIMSDGRNTDGLAGPSMFRPSLAPFTNAQGAPIKGSDRPPLYSSRIHRTTAWGNDDSGMWIKGQVRVSGSVLVDNGIGFFNSGCMVVRNSLIRAVSSVVPSNAERVGFMIYDASSPMKIENAAFHGFNRQKNPGSTAIKTNGANVVLPETQLFGIQLIDSHLMFKMESILYARTIPILDTDGSLTGLRGTGGWLVPSGGLTYPGCSPRSWAESTDKKPHTMYVCPFDGRYFLSAHISSPIGKTRYWDFRGKRYDNANFNIEPGHFMNLETGLVTNVPLIAKTDDGPGIFSDPWMASGIVTDTVTYAYYAIDGHALPIHNKWDIWFNSVNPGDSATIAIPAPRNGNPLVQIPHSGLPPLTRARSMAEVRAEPHKYYFLDEANFRLYIHARTTPPPETSNTRSRGEAVIYEGYVLRNFDSFLRFSVEFKGCTGTSLTFYPSCPAPPNALSRVPLPAGSLPSTLAASAALAPCPAAPQNFNRGQLTLTLLSRATRMVRIGIIWPEPTACTTTMWTRAEAKRVIGKDHFPPHALQFVLKVEEFQDIFDRKLPLNVEVKCPPGKTSWCALAPISFRAVAGDEAQYGTTNAPTSSQVSIYLPVIGGIALFALIAIVVVVIVFKKKTTEEERV